MKREVGDELDRTRSRLLVELADQVGKLAKDPDLDRSRRDGQHLSWSVNGRKWVAAFEDDRVQIFRFGIRSEN